MVKNKINLSLNEPYVRQVYAKEGDSGRLYELDIDPTPTSNGTMRIKRPDGVEVTSPASLGEDITESGEVVSFDALDEAPMSNLKVGIEPIQDLSHGDPSPTNICPIYANVGKNLSPTDKAVSTSGGNINMSSGEFGTVESGKTYTISLQNKTASTSNLKVRIYDGSTQVDQANKTLTANGFTYITFTASTDGTVVFNTSLGSTYASMNVFEEVQLELGSSATSYVPYNTQTIHLTSSDYLANATIVQGGFNANNGNDYANTSRLRTQNYIAIPQGTYNIYNDEEYEYVVYVYTTADAFVSDESIKSWQSYGTTFTVGANRHIRIGWRKADNSTITADEIHHASCYENGQTILTTLPQLVYGGTLDVVQGKLTVEYVSADMSSVSYSRWNTSSARDCFSTTEYPIPTCTTQTDELPALSSVYKGSNYLATWVPWDMSYGNANTNRVIFVVPHGLYADGDAFRTAMQGVQFVYELATPTVIDLTPQQINTLIGENNLWASSGDVLEVQFAYDGMLSALPSQATEVVGRCIGDVELGGVSTMPFTLVVQKNNQA